MTQKKTDEIPYIHKALNLESTSKGVWILISPNGNQHVTEDLEGFKKAFKVDDKWEVRRG